MCSSRRASQVASSSNPAGQKVQKVQAQKVPPINWEKTVSFPAPSVADRLSMGGTLSLYGWHFIARKKGAKREYIEYAERELEAARRGQLKELYAKNPPPKGFRPVRGGAG